MLKFQYTELKLKLTRFVAAEGVKRLNSILYGSLNTACSETIRKEGLLYAYVFNFYEMNTDGSTTGLINYITEEEFNNVCNKVERICAEIRV